MQTDANGIITLDDGATLDMGNHRDAIDWIVLCAEIDALDNPQARQTSAVADTSDLDLTVAGHGNAR